MDNVEYRDSKSTWDNGINMSNGNIPPPTYAALIPNKGELTSMAEGETKIIESGSGNWRIRIHIFKFPSGFLVRYNEQLLYIPQ